MSSRFLFNLSIDTHPFEAVCYHIYCRVQKIRQIPLASVCEALRDMADEHSGNNDTEFDFCLPEPYGFGGLAYPHEVFLAENNLLSLQWWINVIKRFRFQEIDKTYVEFADELCKRIGIAA